MGGTELELKFDAELDAELPSFSDLASSAVRQVVLTSTYWDTADRRIMALGCSLRFRSASDGSVRGWTLKVPAARSERGVVARDNGGYRRSGAYWIGELAARTK